MAVLLGLDIGSNSVGSACVDTEAQRPEDRITVGVSVFPAGVDETESKRGVPLNQKRREKRSQRRSIARRSQRKRLLRRLLTDRGLLPSEPDQLAALFNHNPWTLRRKGLTEALSPYEFGRVLVHLNQRRGALGVQTDPEDDEEGKVKEAIDNLTRQLNGRTFGAFVADLMDERHSPITRKADAECSRQTIQRRRKQLPGRRDDRCGARVAIRSRRDTFEFHADRSLIHDEFGQLWKKQTEFGGELAPLLTEELKRELDPE